MKCKQSEVTVYTYEYENSHGCYPSGYKEWTFALSAYRERTEYETIGPMLYGEAKKRAIRAAARSGLWQVEVCP